MIYRSAIASTLLLGALIWQQAQAADPAPVTAQPAPAAPVAAAPAATAPALPAPSPLAEAVLIAANDLFTKANLSATDAKLTLVVDPLIDGSTGFQTVEAGRIGTRIAALVKSKYPRFDLQPFNAATVAKQPIVLIGTFTPISTAGQPQGPKDAYRVCLALADLKTGKLLSKGFARAKMDGVNPTPVAFFRDAPAWVNDASIEAYIKSCQGTKAGDPIKAGYAEHIETSALLSDGIKAYDSGRYRTAAALYEKAAATKGGDQLRVYNGLYLANQKLGRTKQASAAFDKLVDYGFKNKELAVKLLFPVGQSDFGRGKLASGPYSMWVSSIAQTAAKSSDCVDVVGHTSHTGTLEANEALSLKRAAVVKAMMLKASPTMVQKAHEKGMGWRENVVGTGRDDASDALDRRVQFKLGKCA